MGVLLGLQMGCSGKDMLLGQAMAPKVPLSSPDTSTKHVLLFLAYSQRPEDFGRRIEVSELSLELSPALATEHQALVLATKVHCFF